MKKRDWICCIAIIMLAWLLLDIGFDMVRYTKFLSWQWHLGLVLKIAGAVLLLLLGNFMEIKTSKEKEKEG